MSRRADAATQRRRHRHLELAPVVEEWPDDLLTLLGQARQGYLAAEPAPRPSAAVAAFLQVPAHGLGEPTAAVGPVALDGDVEPAEIELSLLSSSPAPPVRRPLVALGGAAAAIVLVALGLRPMLGASAADAEQTPATSVAFQPTPTPTTVSPDGDRDGPGTNAATTVAPTTAPGTPAPSPAPPSGDPAPAAPAAPSVPGATAPVTTTKATKSSSTRTTATTAAPKPASPTPAPVTPAAPSPVAPTSPTLAPAVATTSREAVLRYYDVANARGRCVARQPKGASRAQLIGACGAEPVPPANLVQYWAAKDEWSGCADPLLAKGWKQSKVDASCGAKPDRATYDVPLNPYS